MKRKLTLKEILDFSKSQGNDYCVYYIWKVCSNRGIEPCVIKTCEDVCPLAIKDCQPFKDSIKKRIVKNFPTTLISD